MPANSPEYISKERMYERGWTHADIIKFVGKPHKKGIERCKFGAIHRYLYRSREVLLAESTKNYTGYKPVGRPINRL